jgi:hypothetical protein
MSFKVRDKVKYIGCIQEQVNWGSCDDPRGVLIENDVYCVEKVEVHSYHTKIKLLGVWGRFNSVCFEKV